VEAHLKTCLPLNTTPPPPPPPPPAVVSLQQPNVRIASTSHGCSHAVTHHLLTLPPPDTLDRFLISRASCNASAHTCASPHCRNHVSSSPTVALSPVPPPTPPLLPPAQPPLPRPVQTQLLWHIQPHPPILLPSPHTLPQSHRCCRCAMVCSGVQWCAVVCSGVPWCAVVYSGGGNPSIVNMDTVKNHIHLSYYPLPTPSLNPIAVADVQWCAVVHRCTVVCSGVPWCAVVYSGGGNPSIVNMNTVNMNTYFHQPFIN
jgi:hypothetical protein